jgi:Flp pilus assembly protein TadD
MGSGLAWGDYDGDDDPDLFLVNAAGPLTANNDEPSASTARAALYRNEGNGSFTDVTTDAGLDIAGLGMGAAWGDYDGDDDLDLAVTRYGTNLLWRNDGDGSFTEVSRETGIGGIEGFWAGASWADFDRDGDADLYICGYVGYDYEEGDLGQATLQFETVVPFTLNPSSYPPQRNLLYRNDGGRFLEVADEAGVANGSGRSLSAAWADFDRDGWPDLYVANDISDNAMYHNRGDGRFDDISHAAWVADYRGAMGLAVGDWNNDGDLDIFVTHWLAQENSLLENQAGVIATRPGEPMHFVDNADLLGLGQIALDDIGWGAEFVDYDNDGRLDLFVVNGSTFQEVENPSRLIAMRDRLFWNGGADRGYFELGEAGDRGYFELGEAGGEPFARAEVGRGAAFADYDQDGDLDAAILNNGGPARLLRNDGGNGKNWLRVVVRGPADRSGGAPSPPETSSFALGAVVSLTADGATRVRQVGASPSYLSQSPPGETWFGLGEAGTVERLTIAWPDGETQEIEALPVNATVRVIEGEEPVLALGPRPERRRDEVLAFWERYREATAGRLRGDCASAVEAYEAALLHHPEHEDTLYYLGQCHRETGRHDAARRALLRLIALRPESARGHVALGALYATAGEGHRPDLRTAERHLRRAHTLNAEETGPLVRLGEVRLLQGDRGEAASLLGAALRSNPKSVEAAFLLGYLAWEGGDLDGARRYCRAALRAGRSEAPVEGVLGEGDLKPTAGSNGAAGASLSSSRRTIFTELAQPLLAHDGGADGPEEMTADDFQRLYRPVRDYIESQNN